MKLKQTNYKQDILNRARWWEIDAPDRSISGFHGDKRSSHRSHLAKAIKNTRTEAELSQILRGRTLAAGEQDLAIRQFSLIRAREIQGNRSIVFCFEWSKSRPEDGNIAKLCILEWLWRITKNISRILKTEPDPIAHEFLIVPEVWNAIGGRTPLHCHGVIVIPEIALDWFDKNAARLWVQVLNGYQHRGRLHVEPVREHDQLLRYNMKQAEIDWVAQRILLPIDLAKYRDL